MSYHKKQVSADSEKSGGSFDHQNSLQEGGGIVNPVLSAQLKLSSKNRIVTILIN